MKKIIINIAFLLVSVTGFSQLSQNHYIPGEKLKFVIYYGLVNGSYIDARHFNSMKEKKVYHSKW
ncbi:MAG: hypothetical protein H6540_01215 [Bacteroidales bacterium]|nr:hypothetical protein [Bacteroidales bacterium]